MPDAVFTQTIPLLLAGGVCCAALVSVGALAALLVAAGAAGELLAGGLAAAAGAGLVCDLPAGAAAGAGFAAGALVSAVSDFFVRLFLVALAVLPESAAAAAPAAAELSALAAFFDLLLDVPPVAAELSDAVLSDAEVSAASAAFLELPFLLADLLSAPLAGLSALAALFLALDLDVLALSPEVELAVLSAASVLFLLLDLVLLPVLAAESVLCVESSAVVFLLLLFFFGVAELLLWSCEVDEPACRAPALAPAHKSSEAARSARTVLLLDLIFHFLPFLVESVAKPQPSGVCQDNPKGRKPHECYNLPLGSSREAEGQLALTR